MYELKDHETFIEEQSNGAPHKFNVLSPYDRFDIIAALKKERRDKLVENLKAAEIKGETQFAELEGFEDRWNDESEFIKFVNSSTGEAEILERSLGLPDKSAAKEIVRGLRMPRKQMLDFKAALCGLEIVKKDTGPKEGESENPPTNPTAYGK